MSVNFNGGMQAQGFGGVNPNANPTPVNNEDVVVNGGELPVSDNTTQGETHRFNTKIYSWDGKNYVFTGDNGDGKNNIEYWRGATMVARFNERGILTYPTKKQTKSL